jgi:hypothetical protein
MSVVNLEDEFTSRRAEDDTLAQLHQAERLRQQAREAASPKPPRERRADETPEQALAREREQPRKDRLRNALDFLRTPEKEQAVLSATLADVEGLLLIGQVVHDDTRQGSADVMAEAWHISYLCRATAEKTRTAALLERCREELARRKATREAAVREAVILGRRKSTREEEPDKAAISALEESAQADFERLRGSAAEWSFDGEKFVDATTGAQVAGDIRVIWICVFQGEPRPVLTRLVLKDLRGLGATDFLACWLDATGIPPDLERALKAERIGAFRLDAEAFAAYEAARQPEMVPLEAI